MTVSWVLGQSRLRRSASRAVFVLGFKLADRRFGLADEGGDALVGLPFRVVKSQDCAVDAFRAVPRSRPE